MKHWPADKVERRKVSDLTPYARNSRTHSDEQVAQIAASIKEWGWTVPVLIERMLRASSRAGDVVIDGFGGSGSTLIAADRMGQSARLVELDPKFVDVIVCRWQEYTGRSAVLHGDGRTFAEIEAERAVTKAA